MRILFISHNFPPETNAPAVRTYENCRRWARMGHAVTVITGPPNFPAGVLHAGYRNPLLQREKVDGIEVIRTWMFLAANRGFGRRTLNYLSFMLTAIFAAFFAPRCDLVIGTSPQFFVAIAAWVVSLLRRRPFVCFTSTPRSHRFGISRRGICLLFSRRPIWSSSSRTRMRTSPEQ